MKRLLSVFNKKRFLSLSVVTIFMMLQLPLGLLAPQRVLAEGSGSPDACLDEEGSVEGDVVGTSNLISYNSGTGNVVTGVCIKSGEKMWGSTKHSGVLGNGNYTGDPTEEGAVANCFTVSGVGTQTVTVTRNADTDACQGLSHIDVVYEATETPDPSTPSAVASLELCTPNSGLTDEVDVTVTNTNDDTDDTVTYTVTVDGVDKNITLADGASGSVTFTGLAPGTYSASVVGDDSTSTTSNSVTVTECEEGAETGSITIIKDAVPNDAQDFAFTATGDDVSDFSLDDDSNGTLSNTKTFEDLSPGTYSFTEAEVEGWELEGISCDKEVTVNLDQRKVTILLGEGKHVTCTFTNEKEEGPDEDMVTLCHATGSTTHPFEKITVSAEGAFNGHLGNDHQNGEDIIPPFMFQGQTHSQNWDAVGQGIFHNNCVRPVGGGNDKPTPPRGGGVVSPASTGSVLGASTLADTGQNMLLNAFVGIAALVLTTALSLARPRRRITSTSTNSAAWMLATTALIVKAVNHLQMQIANLPANVLMRSVISDLRRARLA